MAAAVEAFVHVQMVGREPASRRSRVSADCPIFKERIGADGAANALNPVVDKSFDRLEDFAGYFLSPDVRDFV